MQPDYASYVNLKTEFACRWSDYSFIVCIEGHTLAEQWLDNYFGSKEQHFFCHDIHEILHRCKND